MSADEPPAAAAGAPRVSERQFIGSGQSTSVQPPTIAALVRHYAWDSRSGAVLHSGQTARTVLLI